MTAEEFRNELCQGCRISLIVEHRLSQLIETIKIAAKAAETRRCAARVKIWLNRQIRLTEHQRAVYRELCNEILITGGLEPEEDTAGNLIGA